MKASILTRTLFACCLAFVAVSASPAQAAPAPAWSVKAVSFPTNFKPGASFGSDLNGPAYLVQAVNVGGSGTSGSFTLTVNLPAALKPAVFAKPSGGYGRPELKKPLNCQTVGRTVTCTGTDPGVGPNEEVQLKVPVDVEASAPPLAIVKVKIEGGGAPPVSTTASTAIGPEAASFGFAEGPAGLYGLAANPDGSPSTQAGSHPAQMIIAGISFPTLQEEGNGQNPAAGGGVRDLIAELPPGLVVNPQATTARCTDAQLNAEPVACPDASQVGLMGFTLSGIGAGLDGSQTPLYNMVPPPGVAADLAFEVVPGTFGHALGSVRSDGSFQLRAGSRDIVGKVTIAALRPTLWGIPSNESHDAMRGECMLYRGPGKAGLSKRALCPVERTNFPFVTQPGSCGGPLTTTVRIDSWADPDDVLERSYESTDPEGNPVGITGCNQLEFEPAISAQPTTNVADSPSGLDFDLHIPQAPVVEQQPGRSEECTIGAWDGGPTGYAFQWLRNGAPIPGAGSRTYVTQETDAATLLQCEVIAGNAKGQTRAASAPVLIQPAPASDPPAPATPQLTIVSGPEEAATCDPGAWGGEPTFAYRWFKDGALVPGETGSSFDAPGPAPFSLQCEVTGSNEGGAAVAFSAIPDGSAYPKSLAPPQVNVPEDEVPLATATLKDTRVTLPAGMTLNSAAGGGLGACDSAAIGLVTPVGQASPIRFREAPQACPDDAKIGTVEVETPLLDHPLPGAVYLAKPFDNPFGSLLGIYLAIEDPASGTIAKLAGEIEADPTTGQLSTTFRDGPQLPIEDVRLHLFEGARASLTTPLACGTHTTTAALRPWSTPEGADATPSSSFATVAAPKGGSCPSGEADAPNAPGFVAGTVSPQAGLFTPFTLKLTRPDGSQRITAIDTKLPPGLTGRLAGIPYCSEALIAQAIGRGEPTQGKLEQDSPSCPPASEVGSVNVGAGSGITPLYVRGHAYLAGPYKGAPLSLVIITPAVAGPFDLGTVVVRTALRVNPETAQIHAVSDPLPTMLEGIPLDVRSIALQLDRPGFTLNPTSCDPMAIIGGATAATGQVAPLTSPFQVGGCSALSFEPKLSIRLKGGTKRTRHPALIATATAKPGESNIASASVALPRSEFLDQAHIKTICTRVQFFATPVPGEGCPRASIYGKASAVTPLLSEPVSGPVFLRSNGGARELPDLVAALHGQVDVVLVGYVDSLRGGIRTTFAQAPDAPVTKFTLQMQGGSKGLIVNSTDICKRTQRATVLMEAQSGKTHDFKPRIKNDCKKRSGKPKNGRG